VLISHVATALLNLDGTDSFVKADRQWHRRLLPHFMGGFVCLFIDPTHSTCNSNSTTKEQWWTGASTKRL